MFQGKFFLRGFFSQSFKSFVVFLNFAKYQRINNSLNQYVIVWHG